jgi:hypothetical protein
MKTLEILLRLIDNLLTAIKYRKAQNERDKIEQSPFDWFSDGFNGNRVQQPKDKTDKTNP